LAQNQQRVSLCSPFLPTFSGKREEDVLDFVEMVNWEAIAGQWPGEQKICLAKGALREIVAKWRWLHDAKVSQDWIGL
jgi:hypothetical protein